MIQLFLTLCLILLAYLLAHALADDAVVPITIASTTSVSSTSASKAAVNDVSIAAVASSTPSSAVSGSSNFTIYTIAVGRYTDTFDPTSLSANVGDIIKFEFYPGNFSVARAEYLYPCVPYEQTGSDRNGFFSGWEYIGNVNATTGSSSTLAYYLRVNVVAPVFFYNAAPGFCQNSSFVGVINPSDTSQIFRQQEAAAAATIALVPGETLPAGETLTPYNIPDDSATGASSGAHAKHNALSSGETVGIVIGALAGSILLGAGLFFLLHRHRKYKRDNINLTPLGPNTARPVIPKPTPPDGPYDKNNFWHRPENDSSYRIASFSLPASVASPRGSVAKGEKKISELSAYGNISRDMIPTTPPERRLPPVPRPRPYELSA